jgi:UDP-N-acetylglucosamine--N-acetylmuramyl-(pentapeptide) pyrophosphoryl-undecaprenol N-acetylglucosamine transferase
MSRLLLASGGSGGHLAPAIALAQILRERRCLVATTVKEVDRRLAAEYGDIEFLTVRAFSMSGGTRKMIKELLSTLIYMPSLVRQTSRGRIDRVIATGGFGSLPPLIVGMLLGLPCYGHDSNAVLGRINRWLAPLLRQLFVMDLYIGKGSSNFTKTGFPLRAELQRRDKKEAKSALGLDPEHPLVVFLGGSQGAEFLNKQAMQFAKTASTREVSVLCVTGLGKKATDQDETPKHFHAVEFVNDMATLYSATDIVIARSGAGTLAEITHFGIPCILVPLPSSADDHQRFNADFLDRKKAAVVVEQDRPETLLSSIDYFLSKPEEGASQVAAQYRLNALHRTSTMTKYLEDDFNGQCI